MSNMENTCVDSRPLLSMNTQAGTPDTPLPSHKPIVKNPPEAIVHVR